MTIKNIKSGFRIMGICPFNPDAITLSGEDKLEEFNPQALAVQIGLKYIPLYSSSPMKPRPSDNTTIIMSDHASDCVGSSDKFFDSPVCSLSHHSACFSKMLRLPEAPSKLPTKYPKSSGRMATLEEQLAINVEKEKARKEEKQKEERKKAREEKSIRGMQKTKKRGT